VLCGGLLESLCSVHFTPVTISDFSDDFTPARRAAVLARVEEEWMLNSLEGSGCIIKE
jgi:hypothetical protein